jgi:two-component system sensor histidine kinase SenX3
VLALALLLGAAALVLAIVVVRERAAHLRTLQAVAATAARLEVGDPFPSARELQALERAAQHALDRIDDLELTRERLVGALGGLREGVAIFDGNGSEVLRNPVADRYAGARGGEALVEAAVESGRRAATAGQEFEHDVEIAGPPRRVVRVRVRPYHLGHGDGGALALMTDVTDLVLTDEVRRDFVANLSHELKTPVGAISLLLDAVEGEDDPDVKASLLSRIRGEADRMQHVLTDLIELSRVEFEGDRQAAPVDVDGVVREAIDRISHEAAAREVAVVYHGADVRARADRRQLLRAVANLLENAVRYSDPGGKVEVSVGAQQAMAEIVVADEGVGIPAADLDRVFERFYRVDRARSRVTGGTGLGLSIVRHVANNHGGGVEVVSREGDGSTFSLRIPLAGEESG